MFWTLSDGRIISERTRNISSGPRTRPEYLNSGAERLRAAAPADLNSQISQAIQLAYSRTATRTELEHLTPFAKSHGLEQLCRALFNTSEFIYLP